MPQNRHKTGFRGPSPDVGKATQFKPGNRANPGGRPKKTKITDATRAWLEEIDPVTGMTNAERVARAQGRQALKGSTGAFNALADRTEGKVVDRSETQGGIKVVIVPAEMRPPLEIAPKNGRVLEDHN